MAPRGSGRLEAVVFAVMVLFCSGTSTATTAAAPASSPGIQTSSPAPGTGSTRLPGTRASTQQLTMNCSAGGILYSVLGGPFALRCRLSRAPKANETLYAMLAPLPSNTMAAADRPHGSLSHLGNGRAPLSTIYRYNVTAKAGTLDPSAQRSGLAVAIDTESSGDPISFVIYSNMSTRAHIGEYIWRMHDAGGTTADYATIVLLARPPIAAKAPSTNFFLDADVASALVVEASGAYPPSTLTGAWFIDGNRSAESAGFATNVRQIITSDGEVDVKWFLINTKDSPPPSVTPQTTVTFVATWTPPKGFETVFPDGKVTLTKVLRPLWLRKPIVQVSRFPPGYLVCRASDILCDHGDLQWSAGGKIVKSEHQAARTRMHLGSKLCALVQILDIPEDTSLQQSVTYTCTLRGYERIYNWLNGTIELDNMPLRQGRPMLICLAVVMGLFVLGSFLAVVISACLWGSG
ncbi:glycoprotein C [Psittacid alphaherpesvirus 1]|uniref:Envelope glycoprotein C n=1 Tax=Psittacid herpesvirus 1 (isolate Amazon parrot/-/97-0001/1997) TaxID=670426 RepID=GC_PSHV1|nr:envelope glycoprotein C [Psittacid alphaherpesvirus 1]Q6UDI7.1 RecName: Full=Envelope glycoprotein C; Flags: Precursor [Psittacid herpesvirus 1 Amazon parrot/1997]AAQ73723.1 glycoprotein C [Psittacid alphaherpesvirus 1]